MDTDRCTEMTLSRSIARIEGDIRGGSLIQTIAARVSNNLSGAIPRDLSRLIEAYRDSKYPS